MALTCGGAGLADVGERAVDWLLGLVSMFPQQYKADLLSKVRGYHALFYLSLNDVI